MNLREAKIAAKNCGYAMSMAEEALPQARPDPKQDAKITCKANVIPLIGKDIFPIPAEPDDEVRVKINYIALAEECEMSPNPQQSKCRIAKAAERVKNHPDQITVIKSKWDDGKINLDPLKGEVFFEKGGK